MEISKEFKSVKNEGLQKRAGFRKNKKYDHCQIAGHINSCMDSEIKYNKEQGNLEWEKWIDIHEIAKKVSKHSRDLSSLYGDYFENGRITIGEAEIKQLHDLYKQAHPEGFTFQYGLIPTKSGKKHLAILIRKSMIKVPWGSAPRITRAYFGNN